MHHLDSHRRLRNFAGALLVVFAGAAVAMMSGCAQEAPKPKPPPQRYTTLRDAQLPAFLKGTVGDLAERTNDEPYAASTYGLVGRLRGSGDTMASLPVRQWMVKQMVRHGYGSKLIPRYDKLGPERILREPSYAIVRVDGMIPPGAREGDQFDVTVSAMPGNKTTSLSGGMLFESDLAQLRGNSPDLNAVGGLARARGPIVINPAYALEDGNGGVQAKASLRRGTVMDGGMVMNDRAIILRLRQPSRQNARYIENRINQRFQQVADRRKTNSMPAMYIAAQALDEGIVEVFVPKGYNGDWEHFMGVVEQLYLNPSPAALVAKAKELAEEAIKPNAPLQEISYALEGIGEPALQYTLPLLAHPSPDVSFAMARASVFIGDPSGAAQQTLFRIAKSDDNPFQLTAIRTLGALPVSPERNQRLRDLLESNNQLARTEAYKILARHKQLYSKPVLEKFAIDIVQTGGEPLVYASRSGTPRIALIGPTPKLQLPVLFTAMNGRLMISSDIGGGVGGHTVTIFFRREDEKKEPLRMLSRPDIAEIVARLGGEGAPTEDRFDFSYGEIVAVLQSLSQQKKITAATNGQARLAPFIFEQPRETQDLIQTAPVIEDTRPNTGGAARGVDESGGREAAVAPAEAAGPGTGATVAQK